MKVVLNDYLRWRKNMLKKALVVLFGLLLVASNCAFAYAKDDFFRDNSISLKVGYHFYPESDFMDRWAASADDFDEKVFEIDYDKKVGKNISIGLSLGRFYVENKYRDVLFVNDSSTTYINNYYLSLSAKYHFLISDCFKFYIGLGPDLYHTKGEYSYEFGSFHCSVADSFYTFGLNALAGFEYIFYKKPEKRGAFNSPVGTFIEYKYSWVEVKDADEKLIEDINSTFSLGLPYNDLKVGGHMIFTGLRWHF